ncbi:cation transporter [Lentilactobacillus curieae]|uniref:Cation transporter n=1 Tax=Lentilactobacillus curieae TaxID=1138822 RepID=A0A1S6QHV9_9LACO|nr:cation transporter [Lentilactobacillus curieae]AQW21197.1 cation transporter [Lentilactobacillus curieae]
MGNSAIATKALRTEYFSNSWMAFEFLVGVISGITAHSILLVAFGLDSLLEIVAGFALIWRLKKELAEASAEQIETAEKRSSLIVGSILLLLSVYVVIVSIYNLATHTPAESSPSGITIAILSVLLMPILTLKKRNYGQLLGSDALVEDGMCNITCAYMAGTVLVGAVLTTFLGWWWADSVFALVLVYFIASEGWESISDGLK